MATTRINKPLVQLDIDDLKVILKEKKLPWSGHDERSSGAIKTAWDIQIGRKHGPRWPKMLWKTLTNRDHSEWNLKEVDPCDKNVWRSAMHAASQLLGGEPTDVDDAPAPA